MGHKTPTQKTVVRGLQCLLNGGQVFEERALVGPSFLLEAVQQETSGVDTHVGLAPRRKIVGKGS